MTVTSIKQVSLICPLASRACSCVPINPGTTRYGGYTTV